MERGFRDVTSIDLSPSVKMGARSQALVSCHSLTVHICSSAADTSMGVGPL